MSSSETPTTSIKTFWLPLNFLNCDCACPIITNASPFGVDSILIGRIPAFVSSENVITLESCNSPAPRIAVAAAMVAWPHRSTSLRGEKYRMPKSATSDGMMKAVSLKSVEAAIACMALLSRPSGNRTIPAGLPLPGCEVNTSKWRIQVVFMYASSGANMVHQTINAR